MKKIIPFLICICLNLSLNVEAQSNKQFTGSILWKISGKSTSKPSYILGTHHLTNTSFIDQLTGFKEVFDQSEIIIGELDMLKRDSLMLLVQQSLVIGEGEKGYQDLLSEEELNTLDINLQQQLGIPLAAFIQLKPAVISTVLAAKLHQTVDPSYNMQNHVTMDEYIQKKALAANKQVLGLETIQEQINALFSDPIEEQLRDLMCSLNEMELGIITIKKLNEYYKTGNLTGLYNLMISNDPDIPQSACPMTDEKKAKLLDNRNNQWMKRIPSLLKANSNLFVVGAGHLAGEEGLLFQLAQLGYKVEAIK